MRSLPNWWRLPLKSLLVLGLRLFYWLAARRRTRFAEVWVAAPTRLRESQRNRWFELGQGQERHARCLEPGGESPSRRCGRRWPLIVQLLATLEVDP